MSRYLALVVFFAFICLQTLSCNAKAVKGGKSKQHETYVSSSIEGSLHSTLPCSHNKNIYYHGVSWTLSECLSCTCDNSTVVCSIQSCPIISCSDGEDPVIRENECCESCPNPLTTVDISDLRGCKYGHNEIAVGESQLVDECVTCTCQTTNHMKCETRSCPTPLCDPDDTMKFDGECCPLCPYYLPVWYVEVSDLPSITSGQLNNVVFNLVIRAKGGNHILGDGLLKTSAWATDSEGNRVGYTDQVLSSEQADQDIIRPAITNGFNYRIDGVEFTLDASEATCSQMEYLCVELARGDNPIMTDPRLPFTLEAEDVVDEKYQRNKPINVSSNLVGCARFPLCEDPGMRQLVSFSFAKKSGQITTKPMALSTWSDEFNNVGGAFDSETGLFTSPETGSYFVTYQIAETSYATPKVSLMKNDEVILTGRSNSNSIIIDLDIGDTVWLQLQGELVGTHERYSTFSGFLI